jgi:hypothetical protein
MSGQWQYQVRIDLAAELAEVVRRDPENPALQPLMDILVRHDVGLVQGYRCCRRRWDWIGSEPLPDRLV